MAFGLDNFLMLAGGIGKVANTIGNVANAAGNVGRLFGGWGQTGQSQSAGGSTQQGGGQSQSMSKSGTNDEQVMQYLKGAYQYQTAEGQDKVNLISDLCWNRWVTTHWEQSRKAYTTTSRTRRQ